MPIAVIISALTLWSAGISVYMYTDHADFSSRLSSVETSILDIKELIKSQGTDTKDALNEIKSSLKTTSIRQPLQSFNLTKK